MRKEVVWKTEYKVGGGGGGGTAGNHRSKAGKVRKKIEARPG